MRLDWNEVRANAAQFSDDWKSATRESADKHSFWNAFFGCLGVDPRKVVTYEQRVANLPANRQGFIDVLIPGKLIIEHKSAGLDLKKASNQAMDYFEWLPEAQRPRYILTCDFQRWDLHDLDEDRHLRFTLPELKKHISAFAFIPGVEVRQFKNQKPVNPQATELLSKLHRQLEADGYSGHELQLLLVRLLFMLFADDTGIWPKDQLLVDLQERTQPDGSDLGLFLTQLFETLNRPNEKRQESLPDHFKRYAYINGKLFAEPIRTAQFNNALRTILIDASLFDWGDVSPAIFGALFEGVIDKVTRRAQGAHYTPEDAIFRLIGPLFLEALYDEFEKVKARKDGGRTAALRDFQDRLAAMTFLDPACGAGNFLVVTYRELRELERLVIEELYPPQSEGRQGVLDVRILTKVSVSQFCGIEIDEFPSQIAQVALWMTDHIANVNLGDMFGKVFPDMPIVAAPNIRKGDALEIDWNDVLPAETCDYVLGNPPFVGAKMQTAEQRAQVRRIAKLPGSGGTLDYVAAWFLKAGVYVAGGDARIAFVATNSICQGEQVAQLWPRLFNERRLEIAFAHRTFVWPGRAAVHCVIIGLAQRGSEPKEKRLFDYPDPKGKPVETEHDWLTAYLFGADQNRAHAVVAKSSRPISGAKQLVIGSKPVDGGYLIFDPSEHASALNQEPALAGWLRPFVGAEEYLNGGKRWIAALQDCPAVVLRSSQVLRARLRDVRAFRSGDLRSKTQDPETEIKKRGATALTLANRPTEWHITLIPEESFLLIPRVTSERREWAAIGWVDPPSVPSDSTTALLEATTYDFGILTSSMHMAWLRQIGGRLESRYRYSIGLVYNTFPWPDASPAEQGRVSSLAQAVLDARALPKNTTSTLADLYDPDFMPPELRKAHRDLDGAVDELYAPKGFADDRARVEHLFRLYEKLVHPTSGAVAANRRTQRRVSRKKADPGTRPG